MRTLPLLLALSLLGACGDRQPLAQGERTYQGKRDTRSYDRANWEAQIRTRQMTQNEYERMSR